MISVIVSEYFRRGFLKDALRSVFSQTLDKSLYEVIVVKREEDREVDDYARKNGAKIIYDDTPQLGKRFYAGIEESRGEIITFLEDDDMYAPERLAYIREKMSGQVVGGFRNLLYKIDYKGNVIGKEERFIAKDELVTPQNYKNGKYIRFLGNNSSIAVRREIISEELKKIEIVVDIYLAIRSICSGGYYYLNNYLTYYRIHPQNTSMNRNLERRIKGSLRNFSDLQLIYEKYKNCSKEIEKTIRLFLLLHKMQLSIYSLFPESNLPKFNLTAREKLFLLNTVNLFPINTVKVILLSLPSEELKRRVFSYLYKKDQGRLKRN
ncbi:glycosyltransferase family A protein [Sulfolobus sp. E11-6]|uniref:glycosyltransferase family A protein n=1 Tax=Sulfolobus sp. E11-6 TaxID=2663020 RepID=UPI001295577D|nr:glycosyltransferase family A protein [Sulfolobus sp. E11-6]QGA69071.1 glycosyltransferase [Sulfolobus sp. E11-6]